MAVARRKEPPRAPAKDHCNNSSLLTETMVDKLGLAPSKTQRFRWFHRVQAPKMIMEFKPFFPWPETLLLMLSHHSSKDGSTFCGVRSWEPKPCKIVNQTCREKNRGNQQVVNCLIWLVTSGYKKYSSLQIFVYFLFFLFIPEGIFTLNRLL